MPVQQHSDPFEDRVAAELRTAGGTFDPDLSALTSAGLARGRRMRLRRRAAVMGGAASLALVGVGGALLLPGGSDPEKSSVASKPSASPTVASAMSDQDLIQTLKELLGYGKFSQESGRGTADKFGPSAQLVWDDGNGVSAVAVSLGRVTPGSEQARAVTECPDKVFTPYDSCKTSRLENGSLLTIFQGYVYADQPDGTKRWTADLVTARGEHVSVSEWNSKSEKGSPVTRSEPPLDAAELTKLVISPAWLTAIDAIPETGAGAAVEPEETAGPVTAVGKTLVDLLPDGVELVSRSDDEGGFGYVVVDDGNGKSLVQVNVQPDMGDITSESFFSDAETLADGTKVSTRESGGDKGVAGTVMWTVDTVRTDGLRVVISAFNAGTQHDAPSREKPALTMEQLREIALSPKWR